MNVVSVRSTTTCSTPAAIGAITRCLNSGAVKRSTSPLTETTCASLPTARSLIANSIAMLSPSRGANPPMSRRAGTRARPRSRPRSASASRSITLPTPGTAASPTSARPPPATQRSDAEVERARRRRERDVDRLVGDVGGCARGDDVGDEHRVVEPVERQVGARGEHPDDAAQHRADERAGGDRDARRRRPSRSCDAPHRRSACASAEGHRQPAAGALERSISEASRSAPRSAAARGPGPAVSGLGSDAASRVGDGDLERAPPERTTHVDRALAVGVGVPDDVRARLRHREPHVLDQRDRELERIDERAEDVPHDRDVLRARRQGEADVRIGRLDRCLERPISGRPSGALACTRRAGALTASVTPPTLSRTPDRVSGPVWHARRSTSPPAPSGRLRGAVGPVHLPPVGRRLQGGPARRRRLAGARRDVPSLHRPRSVHGARHDLGGRVATRSGGSSCTPARARPASRASSISLAAHDGGTEVVIAERPIKGPAALSAQPGSRTG